MYSVSDGMFNPAIHQDIGSMAMGMYPMYGMGMYPVPTLLGGVKMKPQEMQDKYETIAQKDKETKSTFKSVAKALFWMALGGFIPPARKYIKNSGGLRAALTNGFNAAGNWIKNIFK